MSVGVVDPFEVVDCEQDDRELVVVAGGGASLPFEFVFEVPPVGNPPHQLGSALGPAIAVTVSTFAASGLTGDVAVLAKRIDVALLAGTTMLALALLVTVATVRRAR